MTARRGFGWALLGAVLWGITTGIAAVVAGFGGDGSGLVVDALLTLLAVASVVLLIGGLVVAAVSLIRSH